ncbi:MAG: hypothetical protein V2J25_00575 [Desulfatiglans sp.]|nr:hypothetical protein [Thermodesulfobacteriota bacterium]MEE4351338.1 hypothetical protein [Desulfatiglans sp.]
MTVKCDNCGHEGSKAEFRYLGLAESAGPNSYRLCPRCHAAIFCEELEGSDRSSGRTVWGVGPLRGRVFTKKP